ncbi:MAG: ABC transporter substrate-binding protein [Sheuella sp.]|nr:ABC transporter substrate-binding protein [Sheuella sp.]
MSKKFIYFCLNISIALTAIFHGAVSAADIKPFRITMVVFRGCEEACKGFTDYWKDRKIPIEIELLDVQTDVKKIPGFIAHVKKNKPDLLITWGTTVSLQMLGTMDNVDPAKHVTDIPALFMIASTPVGSGLVRSLAIPGRNVSGTLYIVPVETQLNVARLYMPYKRIGFLFNTTEDNSKVVIADLEAAQSKFNFELVSRKIPLNQAGKPDPATLTKLVNELADQKVDFLYFAPDTFLLLNRDTITKAAVARQLPVLATSESVVLESDALFGVVNRYYTVGQLTASKAEQVLVNKISPRDIPVVAPPSFSLIVNMRVATELERYPPIRVLKIAEIVR